MIGTDFRSGSPMWIDLGSPDTEAAAAFYGAVFGWEFVSAGSDAGGYGLFQKGGKTVAAMGRLTEEGARSAWITYFRSDDIDATTREVVAGGGSVRVEPLSLGEGRLAQFTDPQGARFAVLQSTRGLERVSDNDALVWVELHVPEPEAALRFYQGLFGWRAEELQAPGMAYWVVGVGDADQGDGSFGGVATLPGEREDARWLPYFAVVDVDAAVAAAQGSGGTVVMPAVDVPDGGRVAWLADPGEALFAVLKPNPHQG
jgi:hypothetical protein